MNPRHLLQLFSGAFLSAVLVTPGWASPGDCSSGAWSSGTHSLNRGALARPFRVYVPATYDPESPAPLILAFHGWGGSDGEFLDKAAVRAELDARGYILIAPVGLGPEEPGKFRASWSFSGSTTGLDGNGLNDAVVGDSVAICDDARTSDYAYPSCTGIAENGCSWTQCTDNDVDFAVALVEAASQNLCVDTERVYAVGGSNGGMFTWDLGRSEASANIFRATASIIGLPHRGYLDPPTRLGGMPALLITGTRDRTVPPGDRDSTHFTTTTDGDIYYYASASATTQVWAEASGCDITSSAVSVDVGVAEADCRGWNKCPGDHRWPPVLDCRSDMGHVYGLSWSWPLVLDFFDQQH